MGAAERQGETPCVCVCVCVFVDMYVRRVKGRREGGEKGFALKSKAGREGRRKEGSSPVAGPPELGDDLGEL